MATKRRLEVYLDEDLYEWIHGQAARQQRSMAGWARFVFVQLRDGLQGGPVPGTLGATTTQEGGEQ